MKYRYFSTMRPVSIGTYPNNGKVVEIHNFDSRKMVSKIQREAWGYIDYSEPLTEKEALSYDLVAEGLNDREDKQLICDYLLETLKLTRGQGNLESLNYDSETEIVTGVYQNGGKVKINVACDSGVSMIRDIMAKM